MDALWQLLILFFVIIDPLASFAVYLAATGKLATREQHRIALLAILTAGSVALAVLLFGELLLQLFSTDIDTFRIAGGIILGLLGLKMTMGYSLAETKGRTTSGIAAIIATPLLTGPAAITAIILSSADYGKSLTGVAFFTVLLATGLLFYFAQWSKRLLNETFVQVMTTVLGLITIAWGVNFVITGIKAIFGI